MHDRHFTRAEVEARCLAIHTSASDVTRIHEVALTYLSGGQTVWVVSFDKIHREGTPAELRTRLFDLYFEERIGDKFVLLPAIERVLPLGCATVEEEDRLLYEQRTY